jgi:enamine deaminase RidA (YjgF/YER057c/UK114 family)
MSTTISPESRLEQLGLNLQAPGPAVGTFVGAVQVGDLVFTSGHGPMRDGEYIFKGKLGRDMDVAEGKQSAELVLMNVLGTLRAELGDLSRVKRVVKLLVLVNSDPEFTDQAAVANGASDVLVDVFGSEIGAHARSAVGMASLPFGISVEIEGIFATT